MIINLRWLCTIISSPELTCLYSSRVIIPSLSVSCMLNKTAEKQTNAGLTLCHLQVKVKQSSSCDLYWDVHLSFSLLVFPRCSSVMCADGGLKWDMTTTNSSKPISWTFPSPFWWKFLKKTANQMLSNALTTTDTLNLQFLPSFFILNVRIVYDFEKYK